MGRLSEHVRVVAQRHSHALSSAAVVLLHSLTSFIHTWRTASLDTAVVCVFFFSFFSLLFVMCVEKHQRGSSATVCVCSMRRREKGDIKGVIIVNDVPDPCCWLWRCVSFTCAGQIGGWLLTMLLPVSTTGWIILIFALGCYYCCGSFSSHVTR